MPQPTEKPAIVTTAIKLLYFTLIIGVGRSLLEWPRLTQTTSAGIALFTIVFTLVLMVWLITKMDRGRNWARITFLVLFLLGIPLSMPSQLQSLSYSPISGVLGLAQGALQIVGLVMLFGRAARPWFRPTAATPVATPQ